MRKQLIVICLLIVCCGHVSVNAQTCMTDKGKCTNNCSQQADSVVHETVSKDGFEKIRVIHKEQGDVSDLHPIEAWESREYFLRQKAVLEKMESEILKRIPVQNLSLFFDYKFNPIICDLNVATREGVVKKVSLCINRKISSLLSDDDIRAFDKIILNTQFAPEVSTKGDMASFSWAIGRKRIQEFLNQSK